MPYVTGQLVDQLLHRVRDKDAIGTSRDFCRTILTQSQRILNCKLGYVIDTATLATVPAQQIYKVSDPAQAANAMRIISVREDVRSLKKVAWKEFFYMDRKWSRALGTKFDLWAMMGRDLLVIWPAKDAVSSVTLVYAKLTNTLTDDTIAIELPDDTVPVMLDLAEVLISLKKRVYPPVEKLVQTMQKRLSAS